jgi:NAD(P)-dependent dehydrogenase (short-subunit alcohol dehydrogenase family)
MSGELNGKVAIITGAANGIGRASAELFVAEGAKVVLGDIDTAAGEALAAQLGQTAHFVRTDVSDQADVEALVAAAVTRFGGLHVMYNNAGVSGRMLMRFLDDDLADFDRLQRINLMGIVTGSQFAARHMAKNGGGSIINTTSIAALRAGHSLLAYRSVKAGVNLFSQSIAIELGAFDIRVNVIAPGHVITSGNSFAEPGISSDEAERVRAAITDVRLGRQPLKRPGAPEDVAQAAMFLASDRSRYITGVILPVDGGITAGDGGDMAGEIASARARAIANEQTGG